MKSMHSVIGSIHGVVRSARALARASRQIGRQCGPEAVVVMVGAMVLAQHPLIVVAGLILVAAYDCVIETVLLS